MKQKHNEGFSLVEVLVAMAILATILIGTGSALVTSYRINRKTDDLMQAQLAVSSKVETLMAEGIKNTDEGTRTYGDITVKCESLGSYCKVTVTCDSVTVETHIRKVGTWP